MAQRVFLNRLVAIGAVVIALGSQATSLSAQNTTAQKYTVRTLPLPDNGTGDVSMDYIAFDSTTNMERCQITTWSCSNWESGRS